MDRVVSSLFVIWLYFLDADVPEGCKMTSIVQV